jgi:hypothetical protein
MRKQVFVIALIWLVSGVESIWAADYSVPVLQSESSQSPSWAPTVSVVGSVAPTWTNNAFFSRDDRRSDGFFNGDVSLRLDGRLSPDVTYRIYARTEFDAFAHEKDANEAVALWGARLNKDIAEWRVSLIYENRYQFAGVYQEHLFTANDIKGAISRNFTISNVTLSPFLQGRYRFSDVAEAQYYRLDAALGIEAKLNDRWSIVSSPFFEAYWFTNGLNSGRQDQIYSASIGLKYNITSNVSLTTSIAYETRKSNVALRHYQNLDIGPRLDFAF